MVDIINHCAVFIWMVRSSSSIHLERFQQYGAGQYFLYSTNPSFVMCQWSQSWKRSMCAFQPNAPSSVPCSPMSFTFCANAAAVIKSSLADSITGTDKMPIA